MNRSGMRSRCQAFQNQNWKVSEFHKLKSFIFEVQMLSDFTIRNSTLQRIEICFELYYRTMYALNNCICASTKSVRKRVPVSHDGAKCI